MIKRTKKKVVTGVTRAQADEAFAAFSKAQSEQQKIEAEMELAMTKVRQKHQDRLSELSEEQKDQFAVLESFALENREELFDKKKSLELVHGVIGFRSGNPAVKNRKGFTWAAITEMLKEFLPKYVRTKEEPDKEKLLADRDDVEVAAKFKKCGITIAQDETFFVEPKKEEA